MNTPGSMGKKFGRDAQLLLLVALLPILGYPFGLGIQVEQFSLIRRFDDPTFLNTVARSAPIATQQEPPTG